MKLFTWSSAVYDHHITKSDERGTNTRRLWILIRGFSQFQFRISRDFLKEVFSYLYRQSFYFINVFLLSEYNFSLKTIDLTMFLHLISLAGPISGRWVRNPAPFPKRTSGVGPSTTARKDGQAAQVSTRAAELLQVRSHCHRWISESLTQDLQTHVGQQIWTSRALGWLRGCEKVVLGKRTFRNQSSHAIVVRWVGLHCVVPGYHFCTVLRCTRQHR